MKKNLFLLATMGLALFACKTKAPERIDRFAVIERNSPMISQFDSLSSLSVGNGNFAFTVDASGLQTFPEDYKNGVPLGTQSQWGWHSFANPNNYKFEETLKTYDFRGHDEVYAVQFKEKGRPHDAANWYRANPHRLHLGYVGLEITKKDGQAAEQKDFKDIHQQLKLWDGIIESNYTIEGDSVVVKTACDPKLDEIKADISSHLINQEQLKISFKFPYPTGKHTDSATDWNSPEKHKTEMVEKGDGYCVLKRTLDKSVYFVKIQWAGKAVVEEMAPHYFILKPTSDHFAFTCAFTEQMPPASKPAMDDIFANASDYWRSFWQKGGAIDFSKCTDSRALELERRVILSQYLMAIQCAGDIPPQETGLTYNSWFGKFHLEMHWWHAVQFALWNHIDLLERSLDWYSKAYPVAKSIAERQGFDGVRWMKMTDPSALEAPSSTGSFLIWQQPHFIYMAELVYRDHPSEEVIKKYGALVNATAEFMASFATYDLQDGRYVLKGLIPAQETLRAAETVNPPFELSYWHYAMEVAQQWRVRAGEKRSEQWDELIAKLSPLASKDGLYLAAEDAVDTYQDIRFTSDHPAVLGAMGMLPKCKLVRVDYMKNTLHWVWDNWNWGKTWGWDYPMTAMCAARLGEPDKAVGALLMDKRTNTYLVNGHNYQDSRLRVYLPGNGGLLTAVAMMCAGWDGNTVETPGFPKDGTWNVMWEDLKVMP
ncbi:hypothetical protein ACT3CD_04850 [Geofilum sp. OHC36d9]|uniref:hypothetical protein n=1 Tax=Geofilum sp. OHC36d9 TaxID=3458413 RepID=UPI00403350C6